MAWPLLVGAGVMFFISMHRNHYGPGGEILELLRACWQWLVSLLGYPKLPYLPEGLWSEGNLLKPSIFWFHGAYFVILGLLLYGRIGRTVRLSTLLFIAIAVGIPLILSPFLMSSDVFDYIIHGRLPVVHHANPYLCSVSEFPHDVFYNMTCWKSNPAVYGPAWIFISSFLVVILEIFGIGPAGYVIAYKLTAQIFHLASGALIWAILTRAGEPNRAFKTALYLFSPLALLEFAGTGHNEAAVIFLVLLGIWLDQKEKWACAAIAFTVGAQLKLYTLPMLCLYAGYRWWKEPSMRDGWVRLISIAGIAAGTSILLYLPFGLDRTTVLAPFFGPGGNSMTKSLAEFLVFKSPFKLEDLPWIGILFAGNHQADVQRYALLSTFLVCVGGAVYARSLSRAVTAMAFFAFYWAAIGATWFMPWYITVPLALVPLAGSVAIGWATTTLSTSVWIIYLLEGWSYSAEAGSHNYMVQYFQIYVFCPAIALLVAIKAVQFFRDYRRICTLPPPRGRSIETGQFRRA